MGAILYDALDGTICLIFLIILYAFDWMIFISIWLFVLKQMGN